MKQDHLYLVYGASGAQGGAVANRLLESGKKVRSITRNPEAADLLQSKGIEAVVGDMSDTEVLAQAHEGVDRVFLNIPVEFDTAKVQMYIDHAIEAAVNAKVELLVVNTGGFVPQDDITNTLAVELNRKLIGEVKGSGLPYIIVEPIVYLENFMIPGVLNEGVLAIPYLQIKK
ncbi:SDR family oxidoreductase [Paenibacillus xylanexedens]|uniref:SDR family oxidoreductase n=1 Tax=Paenibacillus xylanexedens TaxID=528191 RepID=UPI0021B4DB87|nr:NmrA family NAD(P)-binding protein [Paenibacillus xylanexedens]